MLALTLDIEGDGERGLSPVAVTGTEELSELYSFDVICLDSDGFQSDERLVGLEATVTLCPDGETERRISGVIQRVSQGVDDRWGEPVTRLRIVPALAWLGLSQSSRVFGSSEAMSVQDLLQQDLAGDLRKGGLAPNAIPRTLPHEVRLMGEYPARDHVVQYEETDLAFLRRHAEHWGIFFFFEEDAAGREMVVFADRNEFCPRITGDATLLFRPWSSGQRESGTGTLQELNAEEQMAPARVLLRDYNYRMPQVSLLSEKAVKDGVRGDWVEFGAHFRDPGEGDTLAAIRAEELRCRSISFSGKSSDVRLAPGRRFTLDSHPNAKWNREYVIIAVQHEISLRDAGLQGVPGGYRNSFTAIPLDVQYRPERRTPWPRLDGILNGRIDGPEAGRPDIDNQGRYRVRTPFDFADAADGKASRWVRMATPFGGDGDGMQFPLYPGTEVVMSCVNGDPDRPVILGAVPNPRTPSLITDEDRFTNKLASRHGMGLAMRALMSGDSGGNTSSGDTLKAQSAFTSNDTTSGGDLDPYSQADGNSLTIYVQEGTPEAGFFRLGKQWSGTTPSEEPAAFGSGDYQVNNAADGFTLHALGKGVIASDTGIGMYAKDRLEIKTDYTTMTISGEGAQTSTYVNSNEITYGAASELFFGASNSMFMGPSLDIALGLATSIFIGGAIDFNASISLDIQLGFRFEMDFATHFEFSPEVMAFEQNDINVSAMHVNLITAQNDIIALQNKLSTNSNEISASANVIAALENKVSTTTNHISSLQTNIQMVNTHVANIGTKLKNATVGIFSRKITISNADVQVPALQVVA